MTHIHPKIFSEVSSVQLWIDRRYTNYIAEEPLILLWGQFGDPVVLSA